MRPLLFFLLLSSLSLAYAQDEPSTNVNEQQPEDTRSTQTQGKDKKLEFETPDSFEATEKLSEDIAAPFPVDI